MSRADSLQDQFLEGLHEASIPVSVFLVNGIRLQGLIESFDQFVISLRGVSAQVIYKHAISTVLPTRSFTIGAVEESAPAAAAQSPPTPMRSD